MGVLFLCVMMACLVLVSAWYVRNDGSGGEGESGVLRLRPADRSAGGGEGPARRYRAIEGGPGEPKEGLKTGPVRDHSALPGPASVRAKAARHDRIDEDGSRQGAGEGKAGGDRPRFTSRAAGGAYRRPAPGRAALRKRRE